VNVVKIVCVYGALRKRQRSRPMRRGLIQFSRRAAKPLFDALDRTRHWEPAIRKRGQGKAASPPRGNAYEDGERRPLEMTMFLLASG